MRISEPSLPGGFDDHHVAAAGFGHHPHVEAAACELPAGASVSAPFHADPGPIFGFLPSRPPLDEPAATLPQNRRGLKGRAWIIRAAQTRLVPCLTDHSMFPNAACSTLMPPRSSRAATLPTPRSEAAADRLQRLYTRAAPDSAGAPGTFRRLLTRTEPPRLVYFWGGVGRARVPLMDCFYDDGPRDRRSGIIHAFMRTRCIAGFDELKADPEPMEALAAGIAREVRLLCFDEFHVSDIADAMILGRLLNPRLRGVIFVMTSNYPPDRLPQAGCSATAFCRRSR